MKFSSRAEKPTCCVRCRDEMGRVITWAHIHRRPWWLPLFWVAFWKCFCIWRSWRPSGTHGTKEICVRLKSESLNTHSTFCLTPAVNGGGSCSHFSRLKNIRTLLANTYIYTWTWRVKTVVLYFLASSIKTRAYVLLAIIMRKQFKPTNAKEELLLIHYFIYV